MSRTGIVVIGRNEGERLGPCLESIAGLDVPSVYVDSGSTDDSPEVAEKLGVDAVILDDSAPFTAPRGRNVGFDHLLNLHPEIEFVQFLDGDCELTQGWLDAAVEALDDMPDVALTTGHLRERDRDSSIYRRLCDLEWRGPVGEIDTCGGIVMIRVTAFKDVGGFDPLLARGADPELYLRLQQAGWKLFRVDAPMALHNAAMIRFGLWWRRCVKTGTAYAEGAALHGSSPERHYVRPCRGIIAWALVLPVAILAAAWPTNGLSLILLIAYPLQTARIRAREIRAGTERGDATLYAASCMFNKFPNLLGMLKYYARSPFAGRARRAKQQPQAHSTITGGNRADV